MNQSKKNRHPLHPISLFPLYLITLLPLFFLLLTSLPIRAQYADFEDIKNSGQYIWGYGESEDYDKANKNALDDLLSKISVRVESNFEYATEEKDASLSAYTKSVVRTYSSGTLTDTRELMHERRDVFYILRYIKKADIQKIFKQRENKIQDYLLLGIKAQKEFRISDALRYYYWAYALYQSYPYRGKLKTNVDDTEVMTGLWLNDRINSLLSKINFEVIDRYKYLNEDKTKLILSCGYGHEKVGNLDFRYSLGGNVSTVHEVNNGITEVFLFGQEQKTLDRLNIRIEYKYITKSYQDKELLAVLNTVSIPFFKKSVKNIDLAVKSKAVKPKKIIVPRVEAVNRLNDSKNLYKKAVTDMLIAVENKDYQTALKYYTSDGKKMFTQLMKYGQVSVLPLKDTLRIIRLNDETMVRSVPMAFYFPNSNRQFMENVVFTFNDRHQIEAISFAIDDEAIAGILDHSDNFGSIRDKYTLIKFMEFYKTAYSLKRLDYIESIFSDNALIIVGTVLKPSTKSIEGMYRNIGLEEIRYQQYTKKEYIERLQTVFNSKEYVNIDFDEADVKKVNGKGKIYGIQIAQHYFSSNYNDFGYLFLMIDLNDSLNPTIYVRTWQPQKNKDGSIYGLDDFRMN